MKYERGLLIKAPFIEYIFSGNKKIEFRGNGTKIRGRIALIESGSGLIKGTADIYDVEGPYDIERYNKASVENMGQRRTELPYKQTYGWKMKNVIEFERPIPYEHPQGAVIWVKLNDK